MNNIPKPPKGLNKDSAKIWKELVAEYNINDPGGLQILKIYCECYDRVAECRKQINEEGTQIADRFGTMRAHPLLVAEKDCRAQMMASLKQLNLDVEPLQSRPGRPSGR